MRIIAFFLVLILPSTLLAQTEEEPTGCPWGCPTFIIRGSAVLLKNEKDTLDKIASKLERYPECTVTVFSYSDTSAVNKVLSFKRGSTIKNYLVDIKKIQPDRINTVTKKTGANRNIDIKSDCAFDSTQAKKETTCPCDYGSITFKGNEVTLTADAKRSLEASAARLKSFPTCNIIVNSYSEASKMGQAICQKRSEVVKKFLIENPGISSDRISTDCIVGRW